MRRRLAFTVLMIIALILSPSQIYPRVSADTPKTGGTFITAVSADPANLNPVRAAQGSTSAGTDSNAAFDSLLQTDTTFVLRPNLAQSWTVSADGLTYTFQLVQNATFHDGVQFTSADVKYSMMSMIIPYAPLGNAMFGVITSVDTPDKFTAVFHLEKPWPSLLRFLAGTFTAPMMPAHIWNGTTFLTNPANNAPVGTGPFVFKEWMKGDHITYVRNPNYWKKGLPYLDQIIIKIIPSPQTMSAALRSGDIGSMWQFSSPTVYKQLEGINGIKVLEDTNSTFADQGVSLLYMNLDHTILKNHLVRQAIAHAINKTKILQLDYLGVGAVAKGPVSWKSQEFYNPNIQPQYAYNVSLANNLLDQAGYPRASNGTRFSLVLNDAAGSAQVPDDDIIKADLADVGINVVIVRESVATSITDIYVKRNFDLADHIIFAGPDPSVAEYATFGAKFIGAGTNTNAEGYNNTQADALIVAAQAETNETKRVQDMNQWQTIIMKDLPVVPLIYTAQWEAFRTEWVGIPTNPWGPVTMFSERLWWRGGTPIVVSTTTSSGTTSSMSATTSQSSSSATGGGIDFTIPAVVAVVVVLVAAGLYFARRNRT